MSPRLWILGIVVLLLLAGLAGCAPAATAAPAAKTPEAEKPAAEEKTVVKEVEKEVIKTVEVEKIVEVSPTAAPASLATQEAPSEQPTPRPTQPQPTPIGAEPKPTSAPAASATQEAPLVQPTLLPTPIGAEPQPTALVEERVVELEWPSRMRLGDSDVIRLSLIPSTEGYQVTTEFPEHSTTTQDIQIQRPGGYELYGAARLDGVGFEISPQGEQEQYLPIGQTITWRWSLTPGDPGQQRLTVTLLLRWKNPDDPFAPERQLEVYSRALTVRVASFFGMTRGQAMTSGLFGLLFGGGLALFGVVLFVVPSPISLRLAAPNPSLLIDRYPGLSLSPTENTLLSALFNRYGRLALEREFLSGYSGARTFLARPIRLDGRADAYTIVKISERNSIQREFENYERFVKDTLPPITARIQHAPVTVRGEERAAIQYTFIGAPGSVPTSLRQVLLEKPDATLLHKLFDTFGPHWWMQRRAYTFRMAVEYDRVLPTCLVLQPERGRGALLDGRTPPGEVASKIGDLITLRNFSVLERRADGASLSLIGQPAPGHPALRVRWLGLTDPNGACGRVTATRASLLHGFVSSFDLYSLPDPLARLPQLLRESMSGTQSTIHGDLNLENVLVGPGGFVWLIDFATTRDGHTLFDFAHLGAELIAHVIAPQVNSVEDYLAILARQPFSTASQEGEPLANLLAELYAIAAGCLFNPSQPREVLLALYMACLGALKYNNLAPFSKHLLYLTAAHLVAKV